LFFEPQIVHFLFKTAKFVSLGFEKIHMIIFAVMMVFITQASMLMYQAQKIGHNWAQFDKKSYPKRKIQLECGAQNQILLPSFCSLDLR